MSECKIYEQIFVLKRDGTDRVSFDLSEDSYLFGREQGTIVNGQTLTGDDCVELFHDDVFTVVERSFRYENLGRKRAVPLEESLPANDLEKASEAPQNTGGEKTLNSAIMQCSSVPDALEEKEDVDESNATPAPSTPKKSIMTCIRSSPRKNKTPIKEDTKLPPTPLQKESPFKTQSPSISSKEVKNIVNSFGTEAIAMHSSPKSMNSAPILPSKPFSPAKQQAYGKNDQSVSSSPTQPSHTPKLTEEQGKLHTNATPPPPQKAGIEGMATPNIDILFPPTPDLAAIGNSEEGKKYSVSQTTPQGTPRLSRTLPAQTPSTPKYSVAADDHPSAMKLDNEISGSPKLKRIVFYDDQCKDEEIKDAHQSVAENAEMTMEMQQSVEFADKSTAPNDQSQVEAETKNSSEIDPSDHQKSNNQDKNEISSNQSNDSEGNGDKTMVIIETLETENIQEKQASDIQEFLKLPTVKEPKEDIIMQSPKEEELKDERMIEENASTVILESAANIDKVNTLKVAEDKAGKSMEQNESFDGSVKTQSPEILNLTEKLSVEIREETMVEHQNISEQEIQKKSFADASKILEHATEESVVVGPEHGKEGQCTSKDNNGQGVGDNNEKESLEPSDSEMCVQDKAEEVVFEKPGQNKDNVEPSMLEEKEIEVPVAEGKETPKKSQKGLRVGLPKTASPAKRKAAATPAKSPATRRKSARLSAAHSDVSIDISSEKLSADDAESTTKPVTRRSSIHKTPTANDPSNSKSSAVARRETKSAQANNKRKNDDQDSTEMDQGGDDGTSPTFNAKSVKDYRNDGHSTTKLVEDPENVNPNTQTKMTPKKPATTKRQSMGAENLRRSSRSRTPAKSN